MHSLMISSEDFAELAVGVLLHLRHDELLVQGAAIDADAHRFAVVGRHLADRRELLIAPLAGADVARVDAVLVERARARRDTSSAADGRCSGNRRSAAPCTPASSIRCLISGTAAAASGRLTVIRTSSEPACASSMHCRGGRVDVGRVGVGHRLHGDGRAAADLDRTDLYADRLMKPDGKHLRNS